MNDINAGTNASESCEMEVLTFTCPNCGGHLIEETVVMKRHIEWIVVPDNPDYDWHKDYQRNVPIPPHRINISSKTDKNHYCCEQCGDPLFDKNGKHFWGIPLLIEWLQSKRDKEGMEQWRSKMFLFTCPECGGDDLREVFTNAVTCYEVKGVFNDGNIAWGRFDDIGRKEEVHFQCMDCDYQPHDDYGTIWYEDLGEWLLENYAEHQNESRDKDDSKM